jgi:superfamily II DNA or RNA helicase
VTYASFLDRKAILAPTEGIEVERDAIHPTLFDFQRDLVTWALRKGRSAIFADTGLGKSFMQIEWARLIGERTLILAPLAVAQQTIREASKLGVEIVYARNQAEAEADDLADGITITNYERLDAFDPSQFGAVVLDESGILKNFSGVVKKALV